MGRTKRKASKRRSGDKSSSHDAFFQLVFSNARHAASELQSLFPDELNRRIHWPTMRLKSSSYTDAKLTKRYADVLYEVEIDGEKAFFYVLFEHKSEPEPWTLLQLLEYMVRIWRQYLQENNDKRVRRLPIIIPVVLHHGSSGWTVARRFIEYFGQVPDALRQIVLDFGIVLDDVGKVDPKEVLGRPLTPEMKLLLLCLMLGRTPEQFFAELRRWHRVVLDVVQTEGENPLVISALILYMYKVADVPKEDTTMALLDALKLNKLSDYDAIMNADKVLRAEAIRDGLRQGIREGKIQGKIEGIREGIREGKRKGETQEAFKLASKLLRHRFGPLTAETVSRLQAATKAELERMALRVLTAKSLEDVFTKSKRRRKS